MDLVLLFFGIIQLLCISMRYVFTVISMWYVHFVLIVDFKSNWFIYGKWDSMNRVVTLLSNIRCALTRTTAVQSRGVDVGDV
jgi:hypothetical protein